MKVAKLKTQVTARNTHNGHSISIIDDALTAIGMIIQKLF